MSVWEAILLGLVQGLTEFLPVSSSGHLTIFKELFSIETGNLSFEIVVHAATVLSTIVAFRKEIAKLLAGFFNFQFRNSGARSYGFEYNRCFQKGDCKTAGRVFQF